MYNSNDEEQQSNVRKKNLVYWERYENRKYEKDRKSCRWNTFNMNNKKKHTVDCMFVTTLPLKFNCLAHNNETVYLKNYVDFFFCIYDASNGQFGFVFVFVFVTMRFNNWLS